MRIICKDEMNAIYGRAVQNEDTAYINSSLWSWAKYSILVHEVYHLNDKSKNKLWREIKATFAQLFIPFIGGIYCIFKTLTTPSRIKFVISRIKGEI